MEAEAHGGAVHRIGVIGIGIMGERMVEAMRAHPAFEVVAGYDPAPRLKPTHLPLAGQACDLIDDPAINCIYIASPPETHRSIIEEACAAGKAIYCEKPLAASVEDARASVDAVATSGVPGAVNFPFATAPAAVGLLDLVRTGALGPIEQARLTLRFSRWPRGWQAGAGGWLAQPEQGGFLREVGSHFLFLAQRLFGAGEPRTVCIDRGAGGTEERLHAIIDYRRVTLEIDAAVTGKIEDYNRFEVIGERDSAALTDWYRLDHRGRVGDRMASNSSQLDKLALMLEGRSHCLATFGEARCVVELVEAMLARPTCERDR